MKAEKIIENALKQIEKEMKAIEIKRKQLVIKEMEVSKRNELDNGLKEEYNKLLKLRSVL